MRTLALALVLVAILPAAAAGQQRPAAPPAGKQVVTQAWLRKLLRDPKRLAGMIDPARGLVRIIHETDSPADDFKPRIRSELLCGKALERARAKLVKSVIQSWKHSNTVACRNRPGPPQCHFKFAFEYAIATHLLFAPTANGGWILDAVLLLDAGLLEESTIRERDRNYVRKELVKLRRADCGGAPLKGPLPDYERFTSQ